MVAIWDTRPAECKAVILFLLCLVSCHRRLDKIEYAPSELSHSWADVLGVWLIQNKDVEYF